jgi:lipopolysaccharide/colanic/teichoic acid biosynthesis glycosyltransferase
MLQIITKIITLLTRFAQERRVLLRKDSLQQENLQRGRDWLVVLIALFLEMKRLFVRFPCTSLAKLSHERVFSQIRLLGKHWLSLQNSSRATAFLNTWYGKDNVFGVSFSPISASGPARLFQGDSLLYFGESPVVFSKVAVSQKAVARSTCFYTANLTSRVGGWLRWFTPPATPRSRAIAIPKDKLIQRYSLLGSLVAVWQTVRLQGQRWVCFNARNGGFLAKRLFDIMVSATVLVFLSPILLLLTLLIRLDSPGPTFFPQARIGKQGKVFTMWKFRSMYVDAEQRKAALLKFNEMKGGVLFKMKNDPRTTRVGRFLRKFSMDELPQFWNVFVGDMSLVGPRPPLPNEVVNYSPYQRQRLDVAPGITCIWQVSGRSEIPFHQQVEMDLQYIATQSFVGDIMLLLKTVPAVLKGRGAY